LVARIENIILRLTPPVAGAAVLVTLWAIFFWVPTDAGLGLSQRIFYYHVPSATMAFLGFATAGASSALFLKTGNTDWDCAAQAGVSTGLTFATIVLCTGSIWARTAWGAWWTWDARLTTFLVLWLVFASYVLLRALARGNEMAPRYAAVLAIVGALNIPLVMMATRLWRTIHPQVIRNPQGGIGDPAMRTTLGLCFITFVLLFAWLWALRVRFLRLTERAELLLEEAYDGGAVR
jgi:heme exporter protein C